MITNDKRSDLLSLVAAFVYRKHRVYILPCADYNSFCDVGKR